MWLLQTNATNIVRRGLGHRLIHHNDPPPLLALLLALQDPSLTGRDRNRLFAALRALLQAHCRWLKHHANDLAHKIPQGIDAEDALQEILLAISKHVGSFQGQTEASAWRWCATIGANWLRTKWRQGRGASWVAGDRASDDDDQALIREPPDIRDPEEEFALRDALEKVLLQGAGRPDVEAYVASLQGETTSEQVGRLSPPAGTSPGEMKQAEARVFSMRSRGRRWLVEQLEKELGIKNHPAQANDGNVVRLDQADRQVNQPDTASQQELTTQPANENEIAAESHTVPVADEQVYNASASPWGVERAAAPLVALTVLTSNAVRVMRARAPVESVAGGGPDSVARGEGPEDKRSKGLTPHGQVEEICLRFRASSPARSAQKPASRQAGYRLGLATIHVALARSNNTEGIDEAEPFGGWASRTG